MGHVDDELMQSMQTYAEAVLLSDEDGRVTTLSGALEAPERAASTLALVAGAMQRFGHDCDSGALDTMMCHFRERLVMVARTPRGFVLVLARNNVQPGLLLSHMRRLQSALNDPTQPVAEAS